MHSKPKNVSLKLVKNRRASDADLLQLLFEGVGKKDLFSIEDPNIMIFIDMSKIIENQLCDLLEGVRPTIILDIRDVPRFDIGQLNRKKAFKLFESYSSHYINTSGLFASHDIKKSSKDFNILYSILKKTTKDSNIYGPIIILVQSIENDAKYTRFLPNLIPSISESGWDVYSLP